MSTRAHASPWRVIELDEHMFRCPNCDCAANKAEFTPISYECVVRHFARESGRNRRAILRGDLDALDLDDDELIDLATRDTAGGWAKVPKVLQHLNHPLSELPRATLEKTTKVCSSCFALFADVKEMERAEQQRKRAQALLATQASQQSGSSLFVGTRITDPAKDFVMLSNHDAIRLRHEQRREKHMLRLALHDRLQGVDESRVRFAGHAAREMHAVMKHGAAGLQALDTPALRARQARKYGNTKAKHPEEEVDFTQEMGDFEAASPSAALALPPIASSPTSGNRSPQRPRPPASSRKQLTFTPSLGATASVLPHDGVGSDDEAERLLTDLVGPNPPDSVLDLPPAHTFMFELWQVMGDVCEFAHPRPEPLLEDVPHTHPYYHVYAGSRLRFDLPPTTNVEMPWKAPRVPASAAKAATGGESTAAPSPTAQMSPTLGTQLSLAQVASGTAASGTVASGSQQPQTAGKDAPDADLTARERLRKLLSDALESSTKVVAELTPDELAELAMVLGVPGDDLEAVDVALTDNDMRLIDRAMEGRSGTGDDGEEGEEVDSEEFEDDYEEGSEYDSFVSNETPTRQ